MAQAILTTLVLTSVYAILATGIVVLYRGSRVLNLAHGELAIVGGYTFALSGAALTGSLAGGLAAAVAYSVVTGLLIYWLLMRQLVGQPFYVAILATIGIAILSKAAIVLLWGGKAIIIPVAGDMPVYRYPGGGWFSILDAVTIAVAVAFFLVLYVFLSYSRLGIQFRAVAENPLLASQRGANVHIVLTAVWIIGMLAATLAGTLYGARTVLSLQSVTIGIGGLTAALVGGLDSLRGAAAGALIVAVAEYATVRLIDPILSEAVPFIILLAVLMWRPWGLFGLREQIDRV
jgi:branched-chain amino acid transport system permease protein